MMKLTRLQEITEFYLAQKITRQELEDVYEQLEEIIKAWVVAKDPRYSLTSWVIRAGKPKIVDVKYELSFDITYKEAVALDALLD